MDDELNFYIFVSFSLWFAAGRAACSAPLPCPVRCPVPLSSVPTAPETKPRLSGWRGGAAWLERTSPTWNKTLNPQEWSVFIPFLLGFIWWLLFWPFGFDCYWDGGYLKTLWRGKHDQFRQKHKPVVGINWQLRNQFPLTICHLLSGSGGTSSEAVWLLSPAL